VYGASLQEYNERLIEVLDRLRLHSLRLQCDKCEFLRKEVCYLGHKINPDGVKPDDKKVEAVMKFLVTTNTKQLKTFLGLAGYYRSFVSNFSPIAKPLHKLTGKNVSSVEEKEQDEAFQKLKHILCNELLLQYPDFGKEFIVTCDASADGIGGVLSQGKIGKDLSIAYASLVLTKSEINYSTTERELTVIVWSCKQFRPYIWDRKFTIVTDHKPLTWVFKINDPSSRIMRLKLKLQEIEYDIVYKKGKENSDSDGLSRMYTVAKGTKVGEDMSENREEVTAEYPGEVKSKDKDESKRVTEENLEDEIKSVAERQLGEIKRNKVSEENVDVSEKDAEVVAERDRETEGINENSDSSDVKYRKLSDKEKLGILREIHESPIGGHIRMNRTYQRLKQYINWEGMKRDVEKFIRKCGNCQKNKLTHRHTINAHRYAVRSV
jgi:hypothetical protein